MFAARHLFLAGWSAHTASDRLPSGAGSARTHTISAINEIGPAVCPDEPEVAPAASPIVMVIRHNDEHSVLDRCGGGVRSPLKLFGYRSVVRRRRATEVRHFPEKPPDTL
jgi:hypothetical protein